jgi:hypothetical protein
MNRQSLIVIRFLALAFSTIAGMASPPALVGQDSALPSAMNVELVGQIGGIMITVAVRGDYAYVGVGPRLVILNVADPALPFVMGQTLVLPGLVFDIVLFGYCTYRRRNIR